MFVGVIENNNSVRTSGLDGLTSGPVGLHGHLDQLPPDVVGHVAPQLTVCVAFDTPLLHSSTCSTGRFTQNYLFTPQ